MRSRPRPSQVRRLTGQDRELVSAEAGDRVDVAQRGDETLADLYEQGVALGMSERVVDLLEPVEIHDQHGPLARRPAWPTRAP